MQESLTFPKPKKKRKHRGKSSLFHRSVIGRDSECKSRLCLTKQLAPTPHHIIYKSQGGSNDPSNGIALCVYCHYAAHNGGQYDTRKPHLTARQFVMAVIAGQQELGNHIWDKAYEQPTRKEKL